MKKLRQGKILELIQRYDIETQDELAQRLKEMGVEATQATISRDIRQLQLTKASSPGGKARYAAAGQISGSMEEKSVRVLRDGFLSMDLAQNLLVIKTVSGMAMAVAAALDALKFPEVVGCIAGDDTIFAAMRTQESAAGLMGKLEGLLR